MCSSECNAFVTPALSLSRPSAAEPLTSGTLDPAATIEEAVVDTDSGKYSNDAFALVAHLSATALVRSDFRRDAIGKDAGEQAPAGATNWIDEESAFVLQKTMDKLSLKLPDQHSGLDRDEASAWTRWMKSAPSPLIIDLSRDLQRIANETLSSTNFDSLDTSRSNFLGRLGCRLILFPSGAELKADLTEPNGAFVYGRLLYGGVDRFRVLRTSTSSRPPRRAGEATAVMSSADDSVPTWIQYGGADRRYQAVDMGPAAVIEVVLLPLTKQMPNVFHRKGGDMTMGSIAWNPSKMFTFFPREDSDAHIDADAVADDVGTGSFLSGKERNDAFRSDFRSSVGGLSSQIDTVVRRVLDGRVIRPADEDVVHDDDDMTPAELSMAALEATELEILGLTPVRGLLLYGPPGGGKTALAREISRALRARSPKIVSAPELLDRWVGGSEKLVRSLFADAEAELAACNGDPTKSALHVIVIDEIDAVFRKRTSAEDSGEATRSSVVNQILAKLDGINQIPNVLLVGMTNRRELLDEALLRPGRLEVQTEIPLPDKEGRREILKIHFDALRKKGRLSAPLCNAIDGVVGHRPGVDDTFEQITEEEGEKVPGRGRKRQKLKQLYTKIKRKILVSYQGIDLAADSMTRNFSGADIAGLVRCAGSIALARSRRLGGGVRELMITLEDVKEALAEIKT